MILKTLREQVRTIAALYRENSLYDPCKIERQARLDALDVETATEQDVAAAMGNPSWLRQSACDECGVKTWDVVEIGKSVDYDSSTAEICIDCLRKAVALIEGSSRPDSLNLN